MFQLTMDSEQSKSLMNDLARKMFDELKPLIVDELKHDELVSKDYLRKNVFHCGRDAIDVIVETHGFPRTEVGDNENYKYSIKAVDEWIKRNQLFD
ncbi:hypothetical protein [Paucilactobacillus sp. N302-9]